MPCIFVNYYIDFIMYRLEYHGGFESAHQLTNAYEEKCNASIHGHNWKVKIVIETEKLSKRNMVIDFSELKDVLNAFDHKNLNLVIAPIEPTAENLAQLIHGGVVQRLKKYFDIKPRVAITLWETDKSSITYYENSPSVDRQDEATIDKENEF